MRLHLNLLGGFEARLDDGTVVTTGRRKAEALLAYLAIHAEQGHPRDKLAALLWSDAPAEAARQSLRQVLLAIRRLGPPGTSLLVTVGEAIAIDRDGVVTDVAEFERLAAQDSEAALAAAAALYRGDLLAGLPEQSPSFEEWLVVERARLHELGVEALAELLARRVRATQLDAAVRTALQLLRLDPTQEPIQRTLMRLYFSRGRRGAALRQYQECVEVLKRELNTEPEEETRALYSHLLRAGTAAAEDVLLEARDAHARERREAKRRAGPWATIAEAAARGTAPMLGRETEVARLYEALDQIWQGRGRVIVVTGESGIGKSRLVAEVAGEMAARGGRVLVGHGYESERVLAFWPWVGAVRDAGVASEADLLQALGPGARSELARLLPDMGDVPPTAPTGSAGPEAHLRLFDAVVKLLSQLAARAPLLVVLEDLHWADDMTIRLIPFAARRLQGVPIGLVLTARSEELADAPSLAEVLQEMERELAVIRLGLAPLSQLETAALVQALARTGDKPVDLDRLQAAVWTASEGNPFVIVETIRAIGEEGGREGGGLLLPSRVREVIAGRLARLRPEIRQLVEAAAVIGRDFDFALLARAAGLTEADTAIMIEELVRRRLLHAVGDRIDFIHDRVREVARAAVLPLRRRVLHGGVARAMEQLYALDLAPYYAALAHHHREAGTRARAIEYLWRAAERSLTAFAGREAAAFLEEALALAGDSAPAERADLLGKLAKVAWYLGDADKSARLAEQALVLWEGLGDRRNLLSMHMHIAGLFISAAWNWARENEALAHLEAAAALVEGDPDGMDKGFIYQRTAHLHLHRGQAGTALGWAHRAADTFARLGVTMGTSLGTALTYTGRIDEGLAYNEANWESTTRSGNPVAVVILSHELAVTTALLRDPGPARRWAEQGLAAVRGILFEAMVQRALVLASVLAGDLMAAGKVSKAVVKAEREALVGCFLEATPAVGLYHLRRGESAAARAYLEQAVVSHQSRGNAQAVAVCRYALGLTDLAAGDHREALEQLRQALKVTRAGGNVLFELWVLPALIEAHLGMNQLDAAAEFLERGFRLLAPDQNWRGLPAPLHRARGMLARARGQWDVAAAAFERAVDIDRQFGLPWDEARTLIDWSVMLDERGTLGDREHARKMRRDAVTTFERIGAARDAELARAI